MTQLALSLTSSLDSGRQLIAVLEQHRAALPFADEELARHSRLRHDLEEHRRRSDVALSAWREALSRRWAAEIAGQRAFTSAWRQLLEHYGEDAVYMRMVAPSHPASATTPDDLLADLRRLEASVALLSPRPPFATSCLSRLGEAIHDLAATIEETRRCETERRNVLIEQRLVTSFYQRVCGRTSQLLSAHLGLSVSFEPSVNEERDG